MSNFYMNQQKQENTVGQKDLSTCPESSIFSVRYSTAAAGDIAPGTGVKLVDLGASHTEGPPIVDARALNTDAIFGVKMYETQINPRKAGEYIEVIGQGGVIWLKADAALAAGSKVEFNLAKPGFVQALTTNTLVGVTLDKALAQDDLVRVKILADGTV
jgi:hypothetical protein